MRTRLLLSGRRGSQGPRVRKGRTLNRSKIVQVLLATVLVGGCAEMGSSSDSSDASGSSPDRIESVQPVMTPGGADASGTPPTQDGNSTMEPGAAASGTTAPAMPDTTTPPPAGGMPAGSGTALPPPAEDTTSPQQPAPPLPVPGDAGIGADQDAAVTDPAVVPEMPDVPNAPAPMVWPGAGGTEDGDGLDPRLVPTPVSAGPACSDFSPFSRDCTEAFYECRPRTDSEGRCERFGSNSRGSACVRSADCWTGLTCFDGVCREICEFSFPTCLGALNCTPVGHPLAGICLE